MKKLLFLLALSMATGIGYAQQAPATTPTTTPVFAWDGQTFDFGKIKQGTPVTHEFKFVNKGKVALLITNAQPSCGCTTPDWSRQAVAPGEQGFIKATYNAAGSGAFEKTITVTSNAEGGPVILRIKGDVAPAVQ